MKIFTEKQSGLKEIMYLTYLFGKNGPNFVSSSLLHEKTHKFPLNVIALGKNLPYFVYPKMISNNRNPA